MSTGDDGCRGRPRKRPAPDHPRDPPLRRRVDDCSAPGARPCSAPASSATRPSSAAPAGLVRSQALSRLSFGKATRPGSSAWARANPAAWPSRPRHRAARLPRPHAQPAHHRPMAEAAVERPGRSFPPTPEPLPLTPASRRARSARRDRAMGRVAIGRTPRLAAHRRRLWPRPRRVSRFPHRA